MSWGGDCGFAVRRDASRSTGLDLQKARFIKVIRRAGWVYNRSMSSYNFQKKTQSSGAKKPVEQTALHAACLIGDAARVKKLIHNGAPLNELNVEGQTPILLAAKIGWDECVGALASAGANISITDRDGVDPCSWAAKNGDLATVKACLSAKQNGSNALMLKEASFFAAIHGKAACLNYLLGQGVSPDETKHNGMTLLMMASCEGHEDCVGFLLERGANPHARDKTGRKASYIATKSCRMILEAHEERGEIARSVKIKTSGSVSARKSVSI